MTRDADPIPREVIAAIVAELERRMNEARDKWSLTKRDSAEHYYAWVGRELGYKAALDLLGDAGLAPAWGEQRNSPVIQTHHDATR